jgi:hypothetical protein
MPKRRARSRNADLKHDLKNVAELLAAEADRLPRRAETMKPNRASQLAIGKLVTQLRQTCDALFKPHGR